MPYDLDLTGVGFTPTESLAYAALLDVGPSSGYAVAKALNIARANAYQALNGLVNKGAALRTGAAPQQFRAKAPPAVLAHIAGQEARTLDRVERALRSLESSGAPGLHRFTSEREFQEVALRTAARAEGMVRCVAPADTLVALTPLWRKRAADGSETLLWSVGRAPAALPVGLAGTVPPQRAGAHFHGAPVLLEADDAVISALAGADFHGYWTSEPALAAPVRFAIHALTTS